MSFRRGERGQATTEVALLIPIFIAFLIAFAKVFALLILAQKLQIASFYAARRWQLQSHRNAKYESDDASVLQTDIQDRVCTYVGYAGGSHGGCLAPPRDKNFLDLSPSCNPDPKTCPNSKYPGISIQRTQVWNVVTTTVCTKPLNFLFYKTQGFTFCDTKYVPNRDRPIAFVLPGLEKN